jgi:hypothetical protein
MTMYDITEVHGEGFRHLSTTTTIEGFVSALRNLAAALDEQVTKQWHVHHVDPPSVGAALLYAEDGWDGTFQVVLRAALDDAFDSPELLTLVLWTRNESIDKDRSPYVKHVGQAGDDVLGTRDGGEAAIRFYDGTLVDLDDIVAVSF